MTPIRRYEDVLLSTGEDESAPLGALSSRARREGWRTPEAAVHQLALHGSDVEPDLLRLIQADGPAAAAAAQAMERVGTPDSLEWLERARRRAAPPTARAIGCAITRIRERQS